MTLQSPSLIERAIAIALDAHAGQVDRANAPYILHPLRLMGQMQSEEEMLTAILHDTVEDSDGKVTFEFLAKAAIPVRVIEAVRLLTHAEGESYDDYIEKLAPNRLARTVKLADLRDNMRIERLPDPADKDFERLRKYVRAYKRLMEETR
jgi:(p)ppGpp synthase/HD superfamily hydrolase